MPGLSETECPYCGWKVKQGGRLFVMFAGQFTCGECLLKIKKKQDSDRIERARRTITDIDNAERESGKG